MLLQAVFIMAFLSGLSLSSTPLCGQSNDGLAEIQSRGVLIWGADQEGGGPFIFPDDADPTRLIGFEVELADLIARHLGVTARFQQGQWDKLPDLLDRRDIDIVLNGFEWNPVRAERYGTSIPYYIYELQLLARTNDDSIRSWDDLVSDPAIRRRISLLGGAAAEDYARTFAEDRADLVLFEGVTDAMRATELGTDGISANVQDLPIWQFYRKDFPNLRAVGPPVGRGFYVALVRKQDVGLLRKVNEALTLSLQDGRLRTIFERYGLWNETQAIRAIEITADGGFAGMPGQDSASQATADGHARAEPDHAQSSSLRGLPVLRQRGGFLVRAAGMTILLSCVAMPLAIIIGLSMALIRLYGPRYLSIIATFYVELVRGTPLVLQLYVIYFLIPEMLQFVMPDSRFSISAFWSAVAGLAINYSAYEAEIYRAGLQAIPKGQMEAALSLGMTRNLALRRIIVPQATRIVIPPVTNDFIALFKDTAVCSVITVVELSKEYYIQARNTGAIIELGILTAVLYLAMSYPLSVLAGRLEKRLSRESPP
ncbi:MAG: ABC transporter permease subunit [Planctomycetota bacterium]